MASDTAHKIIIFVEVSYAGVYSDKRAEKRGAINSTNNNRVALSHCPGTRVYEPPRWYVSLYSLHVHSRAFMVDDSKVANGGRDYGDILISRIARGR
jgi:hypothetical protein